MLFRGKIRGKISGKIRDDVKMVKMRVMVWGGTIGYVVLCSVVGSVNRVCHATSCHATSCHIMSCCGRTSLVLCPHPL